MSVRFSLVYPTRHRPDFVQQALRILESQRHGSFEVIVCDNYVDATLSCEQVCRDSGLANLTYVRPPRPVGMVENWNHALQFATGDYVCYLTDKMFVLPDALSLVERAIDDAGGPEIVSWKSDSYTPATFSDYFGDGLYVSTSASNGTELYRPYSPREALDRRGRAEVSRLEQSPADYARGKVAFGAYRRELVQRIVRRYGALFHNISPDYTSMVLGLAEAHDAIELAPSCVVGVNTDISNGMLSDTNDQAALAFLNSLEGGAAGILPNLLVPGLYASVHNWVAHDYLSLRAAFHLPFAFNTTNWLVYCREDIYRPGRRWSDARVEAEQKGLLAAFVESLEPAVAAAVKARAAARAAPRPMGLHLIRRLLPRKWRLRRLLPRRWQGRMPVRSPSIHAAVERSIADRNRADMPATVAGGGW
jgi:glycosyltransferase involved in cell wall biosynthesis